MSSLALPDLYPYYVCTVRHRRKIWHDPPSVNCRYKKNIWILFLKLKRIILLSKSFFFLSISDSDFEYDHGNQMREWTRAKSTC